MALGENNEICVDIGLGANVEVLRSVIDNVL